MTDIPDIRAALLEGRYPFEFIRDLQGQVASERRAWLIQEMLGSEEGRKALYVLIVAGTRKMLNGVAAVQPNAQGLQQRAARLAALLDDDAGLDELAGNHAVLRRT